MKKTELVSLIESIVRKQLNETGEMSKQDIQPGGEYYEWAKQLKLTALNLAKNSKGKVKFIEVRPFDVYQGPYVVLRIDGKYDEMWSMEGNIFLIKNLQYVGKLSELIKGIKGDSDTIKHLLSNYKSLETDLNEGIIKLNEKDIMDVFLRNKFKLEPTKYFDYEEIGMKPIKRFYATRPDTDDISLWKEKNGKWWVSDPYNGDYRITNLNSLDKTLKNYIVKYE